ncbi:hypothetical protein [Nocardia sp. NPDC003963]
MADTDLVELPLTFDVPEVFQGMDLTVSAEETVNELLKELEETTSATEQQKAHAVLAQRALFESLASAGSVYAGTLVTRADDGTKLASALLTVAVRPSELANEGTVERLVRTLGAIHDEAEVGAIKLPCGPAVALTEDSRVDKPVNLLSDGGGPTTVRALHVFVPIPGRLAMADFSISSEDRENWQTYAGILAAVLKTVKFTEKDTTKKG